MQPSVIDVFRAVAAAVPARECLVHRDVRRTYAEVGDRVERLAAVLAAAGLGAHRERPELSACESGQDHLALYVHNSPEYLEATLGALAARVAPFNVNYRYTAAELTQLFGDARPAVIVYHAVFAPVLRTVLKELPERPLLLQVADDSEEPLLPGALDYEEALARATAGAVPPAASPDDLFLLYTGGTTGLPKGTMWRNGDVLENICGLFYPPGSSPAAAAAAVVSSQGPRALGSAPFMHATGWIGALRTMLHGGLVAIPGVPHRLDAADVLRLIEREGLTNASLVGEAFCLPLAEEVERRTYDLTSLRGIVLGGVATKSTTIERLLAVMPHAVFSEFAGSSETMAILRYDRSHGFDHAETGVFTLQPRACVVDRERTRILKPGEEGEGWFAALEPLPLGYLGDPAKSAQTFLRIDGVRVAIPGDLVSMRADGLLRLLGRESMTVNTGGEKVFTEEVERALLGHPAVGEVLVVGRPSVRWGQEVVALVRLDADVSDAGLREFAAGRLARYKLPKAFVRVAEIRRNPAGKPDYPWARHLAAAHGTPVTEG